MTTVDHAYKQGKTHEHRSEVRDGMRIDWDVPIAWLRATRRRFDQKRPTPYRRYLTQDRKHPLKKRGASSLHFGRDKQPYLPLPIIPAKTS